MDDDVGHKDSSKGWARVRSSTVGRDREHMTE
jgi:hypothetical protein